MIPKIIVTQDESGGYSIECEELELYAYGSTLVKSIRNYSELLVYYYNYYKNIDDSKLTEYARKVKERFANIS